MSITVTFDDATRTGTVRIDPGGNDLDGNPITGTENLLMQAAIDRAAANTARVELMQVTLQDQSDKIAILNGLMTKLLNAPPADPASKNSVTINLGKDSKGANVTLSQDEFNFLTSDKTLDQAGATLKSYFSGGLSVGSNSLTLASGKSYNDLMSAVKSQLNDATNLNQQTMINYQSLINQRNQMTEWVASLIALLASAASGTTSNFR